MAAEKKQDEWVAGQQRLWESWWRAVSPFPEFGDNRAVVDKLFQQGAAFLQLGEKLADSLRQSPSADALPLSAFMEALRDNGPTAFSGLSEEEWHAFSEQMNALPPEWLRGPAAGAGLEMPGLGYTREWQEKLQACGHSWQAYQEAFRAHHDLLAEIIKGVSERFTARLDERARDEKPVESLRALYDLWVECGEEAYAEVVATPEYAQRQGRMVDALMAWRRGVRAVGEELGKVAGLPTRQELDTAHQRIQGLRREVSDLRERLAALEAKAAPKRAAPRKRSTKTAGSR